MKIFDFAFEASPVLSLLWFFLQPIKKKIKLIDWTPSSGKTRPDQHGGVVLVPCKKWRFCEILCTRVAYVHWTSHVLQGTRKTRSCITANPVWVDWTMTVCWRDINYFCVFPNTPVMLQHSHRWTATQCCHGVVLKYKMINHVGAISISCPRSNASIWLRALEFLHM